MMSDGSTEARPGIDRPITRADLEAKFRQLRGSTSTTETQRNIGVTALIVLAIGFVVGAHLFGRFRGKKRRTIVEVRRT
jgi:putative Mn2+ efflux pump MntP